MANINDESTNTQQMQRSQLLKRYPVTTSEEVDIVRSTALVDFKTSNVMNASPEHDSLEISLVGNIENYYILSDVDQQMIISIVFFEPVNLLGLGVSALNKPLSDDSDQLDFDASGPRIVKLFRDRNNLHFDELGVVDASQSFTLSDKQLSGQKMPLRGTRFQRCHSVQIYIEENQSDSPQTFFNRVILWGYAAPSYHFT